MTFEFAIGSGILALLFALFSAVYVLRQDKGSPKMVDISKAIHEGASAFLKDRKSVV